MTEILSAIQRQREQSVLLFLAQYDNDALKYLAEKISNGEWSKDELREIWSEPTATRPG